MAINVTINWKFLFMFCFVPYELRSSLANAKSHHKNVNALWRKSLIAPSFQSNWIHTKKNNLFPRWQYNKNPIMQIFQFWIYRKKILRFYSRSQQRNVHITDEIADDKWKLTLQHRTSGDCFLRAFPCELPSWWLRRSWDIASWQSSFVDRCTFRLRSGRDPTEASHRTLFEPLWPLPSCNSSPRSFWSIRDSWSN